MKRIVAIGIVLLSLSSVAEAHRLSGTATSGTVAPLDGYDDSSGGTGKPAVA
jgi:hypothetical protein